MSTALSLEAVTFHHPGAARPTLDTVHLKIDTGEMVAVLGPSGSGKSTLLRVAAGLERPQAGDVLLNGASVLDSPPERRDLTVMFQKPLLFPHLDVRDNVAFADRLRGVSRRESRVAAQRYLDLVHLGDLAGRRPRQLSGGQEQRVALARALAAERRVMLLDEPFSSLDTDLRRSMHELLGEVRAALSPTIVMVTHDLQEASLAERVAVLVEGRIEQYDAVPALYSRPRSLAVARLVGGFNELAGHVGDGLHHGVLGALPLSPGCQARGAAVALVRKEHLALLDRDAVGTVGGRVVDVRHAGPRQDVVVLLHAGDGLSTRVLVEAALGTQVTVGERVGIRPRTYGGVWAVTTASATPAALPRTVVPR